jgi:hypothetical protein
MVPVFLFIYQAIVLAEENFLRGKFGAGFDAYCADVNRWWPRLQGLGATLSSMEFNWKRWILKEHTTQYIWLAGIFLLLFAPIPVWRYPVLANYDAIWRDQLLALCLTCLSGIYVHFRFLKKSGRFTE